MMQHPSNNIPMVSKQRQREIKWNYLKVCSKLSKITKTLSFTNFAQKIFNVQAIQNRETVIEMLVAAPLASRGFNIRIKH